MDPLTIFIIQTVLAAVLVFATRPKAPKPPRQQQGAPPPGLGDFSIPTAQEGRPIPIVWGERFVEGSNVTWYANLTTKEIKEQVN